MIKFTEQLRQSYCRNARDLNRQQIVNLYRLSRILRSKMPNSVQTDNNPTNLEASQNDTDFTSARHTASSIPTHGEMHLLEFIQQTLRKLIISHFYISLIKFFSQRVKKLKQRVHLTIISTKLLNFISKYIIFLLH